MNSYAHAYLEPIKPLMNDVFVNEPKIINEILLCTDQSLCISMLPEVFTNLNMRVISTFSFLVELQAKKSRQRDFLSQSLSYVTKYSLNTYRMLLMCYVYSESYKQLVDLNFEHKLYNLYKNLVSKAVNFNRKMFEFMHNLGDPFIPKDSIILYASKCLDLNHITFFFRLKYLYDCKQHGASILLHVLNQVKYDGNGNLKYDDYIFVSFVLTLMTEVQYDVKELLANNCAEILQFIMNQSNCPQRFMSYCLYSFKYEDAASCIRLTKMIKYGLCDCKATWHVDDLFYVYASNLMCTFPTPAGHPMDFLYMWLLEHNAKPYIPPNDDFHAHFSTPSVLMFYFNNRTVYDQNFSLWTKYSKLIIKLLNNIVVCFPQFVMQRPSLYLPFIEDECCTLKDECKKPFIVLAC